MDAHDTETKMKTYLVWIDGDAMREPANGMKAVREIRARCRDERATDSEGRPWKVTIQETYRTKRSAYRPDSAEPGRGNN